MSASLSSLVGELAPAARALVAAAGAAGLLPRVTSTLRSRAEQTRLYRRSLQGLQPYYVAPPGASAHEYGWAFDMVVTPFDAIHDVGYTWQTWGGGWSESDVVHFELPGASAEAKKYIVEETKSFADWVMEKYGEIPWWVSLALPMGTLMQKKEQAPITKSLFEKILSSIK